MTDSSEVTLIIGGTRGIGAAVASLLAARGERVTVVGRDVNRPPHSDVDSVSADLSLVSEVRQLTQRLVDRLPLRRLVFTAGMVSGRTWVTPEGNEANFMVNHVARRLITAGLLPHLMESADPVIGYVSAWGDYRRPLPDYSTLNKSQGGGLRASLRTFLPNDVYFAGVAKAEPQLKMVAFNPGPTRGTDLARRPHSPLLLRVTQRLAFPLIASDIDETAKRFLNHMDNSMQGHQFYSKNKEVPAPPFTLDPYHQDGARDAAESTMSTVR